MKLLHILRLTFALFIVIACAPCALAQTRLQSAVISDGGGRASNGSQTMQYTLGQAVVGKASNSSIKGQFGYWNTQSQTSSLGKPESGIIKGVTVSPNPATALINIAVTLSGVGILDLYLYNDVGQEIAKVYSGKTDAGRHLVSFDTKELPVGAYFIAARVPGALMESRFVVVR